MKRYDENYYKENFKRKFETLLNNKYTNIPKSKRRKAFIEDINERFTENNIKN